MAEISKIQPFGSSTQYDLNATRLGTSTIGGILDPIYLSSGTATASSGKTIPFIVGTGSTAGTWLGSLTDLTAYYDGLLILYKPLVAGASTTTLNINSLGAKTVYLNNTTKLTTHYPANQPILLAYSTSQNSGCWMAIDNYDSNTTPYGIRVYRQTTGYNGDYPLLISRTAASSIGTSGTDGSYSNNIYGVIWNDTTKTPTLNPSTGAMKVPGGITANLTGNVTGNVTGSSGSCTGNAATATKLSNTPNNTTTFLRGDNTWSNTLTGGLNIQTSAKAANALNIQRGGAGEATSFWVDDSYLHVDVINDETTANISFKLQATDTESGGGAGAQTSYITFAGSGGKSTITADTFSGALSGNAATATALTSNAGSGTQPIYFTGGKPTATSYSLSATVNAGTAGRITRYSGANAISDSPNVEYRSYNSTVTGNRTTAGAIKGLLITGTCYGNDAAYLASTSAGVFSLGDPGPQIQFGNTEGTAKAAIIYTNHNGAAGGSSFHFVTDEAPLNVVSDNFIAKTRISIGQTTLNTNYALTITGKTYNSDNIITNTNFIANSTGYGLYLKDKANQQYAGIYDNGSNLWIGATSSGGMHHKGNLYLSAGHDGTAGYKSAYISIPTLTDGAITAHTARAIGYVVEAGSATQPVYVTSEGEIKKTTYTLSATINSGIANQVAYYSGTNAISSKAPAWSAWTAGTTAGPKANIQIGNATYTSAAIPSAAAGASGIVTTGAQQFDGNKTFKGHIYPQADSTYSLGSNTLHWQYGYFDNLFISTNTSYTATNSAAAGTSITTGVIDITDNSPKIQLHRGNAADITGTISSETNYGIQLNGVAGATGASIYITGTAPTTGITYNGRTIKPILEINGIVHATDAIETSTYFMSNTNGGNNTGYYLYGNQIKYGRLYINKRGTAAVSDGAETPTYTNTTGEAILELGNNKQGTSGNSGSVIDNARGRLLIYGAGTKYNEIRSSLTGTTGSYTHDLPAVSGYLQTNSSNVAISMDDTKWTKANWNTSGDYYLPGVTDAGVGFLSDIAMLKRRLYAAAESNGYSQLHLGNNIPQGTAGNAYGSLVLYGTGAYYTHVVPQTNTANRKCFLPNYDGTTYLAHTANNNAVGSSTVPVYVAANGRITQCSTTLGVSITGNADTVDNLHATNFARSQVFQESFNNVAKDYGNCSGMIYTADGAPNGQAWYHYLQMTYNNTPGGGAGTSNYWVTQLASTPGTPSNVWFRSRAGGDTITSGWSSWIRCWMQGNAVTGAVWNDYAEYREAETIEPGYILCEKGDGSLYKSIKRCQEFAGISSDTWGFAQGETEKAKTPIAVSGRVLVYVKDKVKVNDYICSGPDGIGLKMRWWEKILYPHRVVGIVSEIPTYEKWGGGDGADRDPVDVNGRIWIKCCN